MSYQLGISRTFRNPDAQQRTEFDDKPKTKTAHYFPGVKNAILIDLTNAQLDAMVLKLSYMAPGQGKIDQMFNGQTFRFEVLIATTITVFNFTEV